MKIKRTINGESVEIELTETELVLAYREQQHEFTMMDVRSLLENDEYYWTDENGDSHPPELTDEQVDDAACWAQEWLDENDHISEVRWDIIHDAIEEVLK